MSQENVAVIEGMYAAFAAGDVAGVLGVMDPAIEWNEAENFPYAGGNPYVGPDAVAAGVFGPLVAEWEGFAATPEQIVDGGDVVLSMGRYTGTFIATVEPIKAQFAHVFWLRDGKIVRFQQYTDTAQVAAAVGGERAL
jgi:hypothetical protein